MIAAGNYLIVSPSELGNYKIADTGRISGRGRPKGANQAAARNVKLNRPAHPGRRLKQTHTEEPQAVAPALAASCAAHSPPHLPSTHPHPRSNLEIYLD